MKTHSLKPHQLKEIAVYGLDNLPPNVWKYHRYEQGEAITTQGEPLNALVIVLKGKAKACCYSQNEKRIIFCYYLSGGIIGDVELLTDCAEATATVTAISPFDCLLIDRSLCEKELTGNVHFLQSLGENVSRKLINTSDNLVNSTLCTGTQRLCNYILQNSDRNMFCDVLTDTAGCVGISYRHLIRTLAELCDEGVLEKKRSGYYIKSKAKLNEYAAESTVTIHSQGGINKAIES